MPKIVVVTAITSEKDILIEYPSKDVDFIAYTDRAFKSEIWDCKVAYERFHSTRRNAKIHKVLMHQFVVADYSIWIDGNIKINLPAKQVVTEWLKDCDIAVYKHPIRDCIYDEINECIKLNREGEIAELKEQAKSYFEAGYPAHNGLCELCVIVRRHNTKIEALNNYWWSELCRHSTRDQASFMYIVNKLNIKLNVIEPSEPVTGDNRWGNSYFTYYPHARL